MFKSLLPGVLAAGALVAVVVYPFYRQGPGPAPVSAPPIQQIPPQASLEIALPQTPELRTLPARVVAGPAPVMKQALQPGRYSPYGLPCDVSLSARVAMAAQVALSLQANCALSRALTVHHAGMRFSGRTDDQGRYQVLVPALTRDAVFSVAFADGETVEVHVPVPEAAVYWRSVLQWRGDLPARLEAREFGAADRTRGHIWPGAPGRAEGAEAGRGGFLSQLGDGRIPDGHYAQVYSFPRRVDRAHGVVRVSIGIEVTPANCGQVIEAETLQPGPAGLRPAGLRAKMPDCTRIGEFLVLKNPLRDLKIVQN